MESAHNWWLLYLCCERYFRDETDSWNAVLLCWVNSIALNSDFLFSRAGKAQIQWLWCFQLRLFFTPYCSRLSQLDLRKGWCPAKLKINFCQFCNWLKRFSSSRSSAWRRLSEHQARMKYVLHHAGNELRLTLWLTCKFQFFPESCLLKQQWLRNESASSILLIAL